MQDFSCNINEIGVVKRDPHPNGLHNNLLCGCCVRQNSIIMNVLAPDIQVYDANGNYAPNAHNATKDSLSIGIGYTAVQASFPDQ